MFSPDLCVLRKNAVSISFLKQKRKRAKVSCFPGSCEDRGALQGLALAGSLPRDVGPSLGLTKSPVLLTRGC